MKETADIETASENYASRFKGPTGQWFLEMQERAVLALTRNLAIERVADVGGGHAQLTGAMLRAGYELTVTGSSESAGRRLEDFDSGHLNYVVADSTQLPFEDRAFDLVLCFRLLTHCNRPGEVVAELCRVADKAVVIDYPAKRSVNAFAPLMFKAKKRVEKNTRTWHDFADSEIAALFEQHGFVMDRTIRQFFMPMALHRFLSCCMVSRIVEGTFRALGLVRLFGSPVVARMTRDHREKG